MKNPKLEAVKIGTTTVKIYRRITPDGHTRFEVADRSTGTRILRGFSNHERAVAEAIHVARLMHAGEANAARFRGTDAASYGRALELLKPTGVAIELAAARFAEAWARLGGDRLLQAVDAFLEREQTALPRRTVQSVIDDLLASKSRNGKSARYLADLRSKLARFGKAFDTDIASITGPDIQHWLDGLPGAPVTKKGFRSVLHLLFSFAETRGYTGRGANPAALTERIVVKNGDVQVYTPAELGRLLAAASPDFLPCLAIQAFAGLRSAELERLTWADVLLDRGHITLTAGKAKTAMRRIVPISENLRAWLAPYAGRTGLVWTGSHSGFYKAQSATAEAAGIAWRGNAMRHSAVSYRLAIVQNVAQVAMEAGNSAGIVQRHYREVVTPAEGAAWFGVMPGAIQA